MADVPARYFTVRAGSLVAWDGTAAGPRPFRVDRRAHRQPQPAGQAASRPGGRRLAGGGAGALRRCVAEFLAGPRPGHQRTAVGARRRAGVAHRLVRIDDPILRVPQLAIHLAEDRKSLTLDPQRHVNAVWGVGCGTRSFIGYVAERPASIPTTCSAADLMTHDLTPSPVTGVDDDFSARLGWTTRPAATRVWRRSWTSRRPNTCRCWRCSTTRRSGRPRITARNPSCC